MQTPVVAELRALELLAGLPEPTPQAMLIARLAAGHSQADAAAIVGLGKASRWSEYERGARVPDVARWALYLLATGQHPDAQVVPRRRGKVSPADTPAAVEKS